MNKKLCIVGLGYVGLPLALEFAKKGYKVVGFDINGKRIADLNNGIDITEEVETNDLRAVLSSHLTLTNSLEKISDSKIYIVTVPTPITEAKTPDLTPLEGSSKMLGSILKNGDIVIYESTVYPGCTEEVCVPILEKESGLKFNTDFFVGYSPERINPGDKKHRVHNIRKVTSGSTDDVADEVDALYQSILEVPTHKASSIKVAEASKVIENSQRDINIAFVNELAKIFNLLGIDTKEVLEAAGTKWNFLPFTPGLVGGHCIGVDPYYLAHQAKKVGYHPEIILAGRRINDSMGGFVAKEVIKQMIMKDIPIKGSRILILGFTFKENCPDVRNTRVIDIYNELKTYGVDIDVYEPWVDVSALKDHYNVQLIDKNELAQHTYEAVILAVAHEEFKTLDFNSIRADNSVVYDVKSVLSKELIDIRL